MTKYLVCVLGLFVACPATAEIASVSFVTSRDNAAVHKNGNETIDGTKTFNQIPMIPTADLPTLQS